MRQRCYAVFLWHYVTALAGDCPKGDDALTSGAQNEVQFFNCYQVVADEFYLMYKEQLTAPILKTASASEVEAALNALSTMSTVRVTFHIGSGSATAACQENVAVRVEFLQEFGE